VSDPDAPPLDPDALISALERHKVSFVAVGGLAAQWHGAQRTTKDLDVCPAWDRENLDHVAGALRELGARLKVPDGPAEGEEFPVDGAFLHHMELSTWRTSAGDLDVLMGIPRDTRWDLARYEQLREGVASVRDRVGRPSLCWQVASAPVIVSRALGRSSPPIRLKSRSAE
jgi:hypothetical protein